MKKLLCMILALMLVFALCACGAESDTQESEEMNTTEQEPSETKVTEEETTVDDGKVEYTVTVVDEDGNPITDVKQVQVCDETNSCSIILLTDGTGTMRLTEAVYHATLMTLPEGYEYVGEETEFSFDSSNSCTITLKEADGKVEYTVTVVDEAGNPIADVKQVQVCDDTNMCSIILLTDGTGSMRLAEAVYHATLMTMPEGYDYATEETEFSFDEDNSCTIVLKAVA